MNTANRVISKLGGTRKVAAMLGIAPSTVQSWKGTGVIPVRHQRQILDAASRAEIALTAEELVPTAIESASARAERKAA